MIKRFDQKPSIKSDSLGNHFIGSLERKLPPLVGGTSLPGKEQRTFYSFFPHCDYLYKQKILEINDMVIP